MAEKYNASNIALEQILNFIKSGEIAIPEIQRPFVWKPRQVRDLIDSLYTGYPTGYFIISQSPNMKLKDGTLSEGKKIMIDGQQRVTALMTAIMGMEVINANFEKKRIKIAFNPLANPENEEEIFEDHLEVIKNLNPDHMIVVPGRKSIEKAKEYYNIISEEYDNADFYPLSYDKMDERIRKLVDLAETSDYNYVIMTGCGEEQEMWENIKQKLINK